MATTIIGKPDKYSPVFNPIYFYMDSTNKTEEGFKYLVDVYSASTADKINRYSIFPRPVDGVGVADINQVLKSQIGCYINQTQNFIETAEEDYFNYDIVFSEQYLYKWSFYDNYAASGLTLGLYSVDATHYFEVGDFVNVVQNSGATNPEYDGVHRVVKKGYNYIELDTPFLSASPVNSGYVTIANLTPTQFITPREVLYNNFLYSGTSENFASYSNQNGWDEWSNGCNDFLKVVNGTIQFKIFNDTCGSIFSEEINATATTLNPGSVYEVSYNVLATPTTANSFYIQSNFGSGVGTPYSGNSTFTETIQTGTGLTQFSLIFYMDMTGIEEENIIIIDNLSVKEISQVTGYTAFNSAIKHQDLLTYTSSTYAISGFTNEDKKLLTGLPQNYKVKLDNKLWLNLLVGDLGTLNYAGIITRYGEYILNNYEVTMTGGTTQQNNCIQLIPIGPKNVSEIEGTVGPSGGLNWSNEAGSYPIFKNECWDFYAFESVSGGTVVRLTGNTINPWSGNSSDQLVEFYINGVLTQAYIQTENNTVVELLYPYSAFTGISSYNIFQLTEEYTIYISSSGFEVIERLTLDVDWTTTRYGNVELYFIDRLGSLVPVNFALQNRSNIAINRSEYQTLPGNLINPGPSGRWQFSSPQRGKRTLSTQATKSISLISDWLREEDIVYLQELFTSPLVYIKENGLLWPVVPRTDSFEIVNKKNRKNIQIAITVEYANKDSIQQF
jgi:hypothetical protein